MFAWTPDLAGWFADVGRSGWVRQMGILVAVTLLSWPVARAIVRRVGNGTSGDRGERSLLRVLARASVWPLVALASTAIVLEVWNRVSPGTLGDSRGVLPTLVFFLVWRLINAMLLELMPKGPVRRRVRRVVVPLLFVLLVLQQLDLLGPLLLVLQRPLVVADGASLTLSAVMLALGVLIAVSVFAGIAQSMVARAVLPQLGMEPAVAEAIGTIVRYVLVVLGIVWALEVLGFDLTTLKIAFGALGVGIGFGLQNVVNNFTSGLILLFERTVKRGDVLTVDGMDGRVQHIGLRSSVIRTRAGDDLILPNSILVENMVTNYSYGDELKRVDIDVGVSYASDPHTVHDLLLEVGRRSGFVLPEPAPTVLFVAFGESSLDFQLRVWIEDAWAHPTVRSQLHFDVWYALRDAGIEIPFPQRDLHLRTGGSNARAPQTPAGEGSA